MAALRNSVSVAKVLPVLGDMEETIWRVLAVAGSFGRTRQPQPALGRASTGMHLHSPSCPWLCLLLDRKLKGVCRICLHVLMH